jgi:hypothetical protein
MPSHLKELVRARMEKTGEGYQQALRHIRAQEERAADASSIAEEKIARSRTVADTAFSIAVVRAEEGRRPDGEQLFVDPCESAFAVPGGHVAESTQRFLDLPFFRDGVRLRTRFLDDCVREGLAAGLDQIVLLGAGFDARGLRMTEIASHRATVFEGDTPYQMDRKRRALASAKLELPAHVVYVRSTSTRPTSRTSSVVRSKWPAMSSGSARCSSGRASSGTSTMRQSIRPCGSSPGLAVRAAVWRSRSRTRPTWARRRWPHARSDAASLRSTIALETPYGESTYPANRTRTHG